MEFKTYVLAIDGAEQLGLARLGLQILGYVEERELYPHAKPTHITTSTRGTFRVRCYNGDYQGVPLTLGNLNSMVEVLESD